MTEHFLAIYYRRLRDYTDERYRFLRLTYCFAPFAILFSLLGAWLDHEPSRIAGGLFSVATLIFSLYYLAYTYFCRRLQHELDGPTAPRTATRFQTSAQGCDAVATLGKTQKITFNPEGVADARRHRRQSALEALEHPTNWCLLLALVLTTSARTLGDGTNRTDVRSGIINASDYTYITATDWTNIWVAYPTNVIWNINAHDADAIALSISTNIQTIFRTNRVLTIIHQGRTNRVTIALGESKP